MKYELLAILPLTGTDDEMKVMAQKIEERIKSANGAIYASTPLQKGRLAYAMGRVRQGYYHLIQFEVEPPALAEFRRALILSGETTRFTVSKINGEFKSFIPSAPKASPVSKPRAMPGRPAVQYAPVAPAAAAPRVQETVKPEAAPKVSLEEIDKRLEKILGE